MNRHILILLIAAFVVIAVHGENESSKCQNCCEWPIFGLVTTNILLPQFDCNTPIEMYCSCSNCTGSGVAGVNNASDFEVVATAYGKTRTDQKIICGAPDSNKWHLDGQTAEFPRFGCAFKHRGNDKWILRDE